MDIAPNTSYVRIEFQEPELTLFPRFRKVPLVLTELHIALYPNPGTLVENFRQLLELIEDGEFVWDSTGIFMTILLDVPNLSPLFTYIMNTVRQRTHTLAITVGGDRIPSDKVFWDGIRDSAAVRLSMLRPDGAPVVIFTFTDHSNRAFASLKNLMFLDIQIYVEDPTIFTPALLANPKLDMLTLSMRYNAVISPQRAAAFIRFFHELYLTHPKLMGIRLEYNHPPEEEEFIESEHAREYFALLLKPLLLMDRTRNVIIVARSEQGMTEVTESASVAHAIIAHRFRYFMSRFPSGVGMPRLAGLLQDSWGHYPEEEEQVAVGLAQLGI